MARHSPPPLTQVQREWYAFSAACLAVALFMAWCVR